eukprot:750124-Hanusia_phi.AAC.1
MSVDRNFLSKGQRRCRKSNRDHLLEASFRPPKPVIPAKNVRLCSSPRALPCLSRLADDQGERRRIEPAAGGDPLAEAREMEAFQAEHAANLAENKLREALQRK